MEAISSADFAQNDTPAEPLNKTPNDLDKVLNSGTENPTKTFTSDKPKVNSFQQMLAE